MPSQHAVTNGRYVCPSSRKFVYRWYCKCPKGQSEGTFGNCVRCHHCGEDTRTRQIKQQQSEACDKHHAEQQRNSRNSNNNSDSNQNSRDSRSRRRSREHHSRRSDSPADRRPQSEAAAAAREIKELKQTKSDLSRQLADTGSRSPPNPGHHSGSPSHHQGSRHSTPSSSYGQRSPSDQPHRLSSTHQPKHNPVIYTIHYEDDPPEPPSEAECAENLACLEAELKFYVDQLQNYPKSKDYHEAKLRVTDRIVAAKENLRLSKAPVDQLAGKATRLKKVETK